MNALSQSGFSPTAALGGSAVDVGHVLFSPVSLSPTMLLASPTLQTPGEGKRFSFDFMDNAATTPLHRADAAYAATAAAAGYPAAKRARMGSIPGLGAVLSSPRLVNTAHVNPFVMHQQMAMLQQQQQAQSFFQQQLHRAQGGQSSPVLENPAAKKYLPQKPKDLERNKQKASKRKAAGSEVDEEDEDEDDDPRMRLAPGATKIAGKRWTAKQDAQLKAAVEKYNFSNWKMIADEVDGRSHVQCLQRWKKVLQPGLIKGLWSAEEDQTLVRLIEENGGAKCWTKIATQIPGRTAKQCRERWHLNLDPSINRAPWTKFEDELLLGMHERIGNRWAEIKRALPGRTENGVKSRFKSLQRAIKKRQKQQQRNRGRA